MGNTGETGAARMDIKRAIISNCVEIMQQGRSGPSVKGCGTVLGNRLCKNDQGSFNPHPALSSFFRQLQLQINSCLIVLCKSNSIIKMLNMKKGGQGKFI